MASDLDYFYEKDLNRSDLKNFYNSLPSRLQTKFKNTTNAIIILDNVLQGYRGPSSLCDGGSGDSGALESSYGIQEIQFWWGMTKQINLIPIVGTMAFGLLRGLQKVRNQLEWHSLYFDSKTGECLSHNKNEAAEKLNTKGEQLFAEGRYIEAAEYHYNAYRFCSDAYKHQQKFEDNRSKAKTEVDAIDLKSLGEDLFREGNYSEAYSKFEKACDKSQITEEIQKYVICKNKAKVELDAIELKQLGDVEFNAGRYDNAKVKYEEAYNKTQITKEKNTYAINKEKVQTIINKLLILDILWNKGWTAENDTESDRSGEAREIFQLVLNESKESLKIFPDNLKFKQYEILVSLKVEGNELFNQGHEFQQNGIELLREANELKRQQKFELAHKKFEEAKHKFFEAQEKFIRGSKRDERFLSCIEFVQEQLNEVIQSIEVTKTHTLNQRLQDLNINISENDQNTNVYNSNITEEQHVTAIMDKFS